MSRRAVLLLSVILALVSAVLLQMYKKNIAAELGVGGPRIHIVTARTDIPAWSAVDKSQLEIVAYPEAWAPPSYVPEALMDELVGRTTGMRVLAGQPLLTLHLATATNGHRLSRAIEPGMRALPLSIDKVTAFGGLLKPGDYVDILLTFAHPRDRRVETRTLLQGVAVLAVGGSLATSDSYAARGGGGAGSRPGTTRINNVTVLVTAEEAELLVMAEDQGELSLTMRSMDDVGSEKDLPGRELSDLLEDERIEAIQEGRDRRNCVTVNAAGRGSSTKCTE